MAPMTARDNFIVVTRGMLIDCYDYLKNTHQIINVETNHTDDYISDVVISSNLGYLAILTFTSKQLIIFELPLLKEYRKYILPRSGSKIRFSVNDEQIFVADKTGDILSYALKNEDNKKLLGHLSLLLNVLQTNDSKYIISSDRDEKIRVSCYPNTYNIQTYCLGHKEFVNHIELLPHNDKYLTSTSGDGTVKCWDYIRGKLCYNIDTCDDVNDDNLKEDFMNIMNEDGIEVNSLPIVHYSTTKLHDTCSILAAMVYTFNYLLLYSLQNENQIFSHKLEDKLYFEHYPAAVEFYGLMLFVYDEVNCHVNFYKINYEKQNVILELHNKCMMFDTCNVRINSIKDNNSHSSIKLLYKRKYDNVQEYQERKKQRLVNNK